MNKLILMKKLILFVGLLFFITACKKEALPNLIISAEMSDMYNYQQVEAHSWLPLDINLGGNSRETVQVEIYGVDVDAVDQGMLQGNTISLTPQQKNTRIKTRVYLGSVQSTQTIEVILKTSSGQIIDSYDLNLDIVDSIGGNYEAVYQTQPTFELYEDNYIEASVDGVSAEIGRVNNPKMLLESSITIPVKISNSSDTTREFRIGGHAAPGISSGWTMQNQGETISSGFNSFEFRRVIEPGQIYTTTLEMVLDPGFSHPQIGYTINAKLYTESGPMDHLGMTDIYIVNTHTEWARLYYLK